MTGEKILSEFGEAWLFADIFSAEESRVLFEQLRHEIKWRHEPIRMFGKTVMQPRLTGWHGDPDTSYRYSGLMMAPNLWTETLLKIKRRIEPLADTRFNGVLLNLYRDQNDGMGWHRDNEKELLPEPTIGSVSFGAARPFRFRLREDHLVQKNVMLNSGSFLLMRGECQEHWEHALPKLKTETGPRINLTFRRIRGTNDHE